MYYERLKSTREDADETQTTIAKILKITQQQYSLYESGKRPLPIDLLERFCLHYKVSADYILELPKGLKHPR